MDNDRQLHFLPHGALYQRAEIRLESANGLGSPGHPAPKAQSQRGLAVPTPLRDAAAADEDVNLRSCVGAAGTGR